MTSQDIINAAVGKAPAGQAQINRDSTEYRMQMRKCYLALAKHYSSDTYEHQRYLDLAEEMRPVGS